MRTRMQRLFFCLLGAVLVLSTLTGCPNSGPTICVPDLSNMTQAEATPLLLAEELCLGRVSWEYSVEVPAGGVIAQEPPKETMVAPGTRVDLVFSKGKNLIAVPNLLEMTEGEAQAQLLAAGFAVGALTEAYSDTVPVGGVLSQEPVAGTRVASNSSVALVVSKGPEFVLTPSVEGMLQGTAESAITFLGLAVGDITEAYSDSVPVGRVIAQEPIAGSSVAPNSAVALLLSRGPEPIAVPNLVGMTEAGAVSQIIASGFATGGLTREYSEQVAAGLVMGQTPVPEAYELPNTPIELIISQGPQPIAVPDVRNMTRIEAESTLSAVGLRVSIVQESYSDTVPAGQVVSQEPAAGMETQPDTSVMLIFSQGPEPVVVPELTGLLQSEVESALSAVGLAVGEVTEAYSDVASMGHAAGQTPAAGTTLLPGRTVDIVISKGVDLRIAEYELDAVWPKWPLMGAPDADARGVAIDLEGNVYVVDWKNSQIRKFTSEGVLLTTWGAEEDSEGNGKLSDPFAIAVDAAGAVYVSDIEEHCIQKFTSEGEFLTKWGGEGETAGSFSYPSGIAVDFEGAVYVVDCCNHRIQKFTSEGDFITTWGEKGDDAGAFSYPRGIAVNSEGQVYVADSNNNRIQRFTTEGGFLGQWGTEGEGDGQFQHPISVVIDASGSVYVVDKRVKRIQKFTSVGVLQGEWEFTVRNESSRFNGSMTVAGANSLYLYDADNFDITEFGFDGELLVEWELDTPDLFVFPSDIAVSSDGYVYVVDTWHYCIQKFDAAGAFILKWGSKGDGDGEFIDPAAIALDAFGNVYVSDMKNFRVQKFNAEGVFLKSWNTTEEPYTLSNPDMLDVIQGGLAVDASGNVYVANTLYRCVQKFTSEGTLLMQWGERGSTNGCFETPTDIAVDNDGIVYVVDAGNHRLQQFTTNGAFLSTWKFGYGGVGYGSFFYPLGIAVDRTGNVYLSDLESTTLQKFSPWAIFMRHITYSHTSSYISFGIQMDIDTSGNVYIVDLMAGQVFKFKPVMPD